MHPLVIVIGATLVLGAAKAAVAVATGSQAVAASAADSLADAVVSGVNLLMMRQAARPADAGHPWGHGKVEALASLAQSLVLAGIIVVIAIRALASLVAAGSGAVPVVGPAFVAMCLSVGCSLGISAFLARAASSTGSMVLSADATHYRMDVYSGAAVLAGLALARLTGSGIADSLAALVVSGLMVRDVWALGRDAVDELMDRPLPPDKQARIAAVLAGFTAVRSWHDLRTRRAGPIGFVQVHVVLARSLGFAEAHRITDEIEAAMRAVFPELDVLVHADVEGEPDRTDAR